MRRWAFGLVVIAVLGAACTGGGGGGGTPSAGGCTGKVSGAPVTLKAWFHSGTGAERDTLASQADAFNASQTAVKVQLVLLPEGNYGDQVKARQRREASPISSTSMDPTFTTTLGTAT